MKRADADSTGGYGLMQSEHVMSDFDAKQLHPLALAYMGDAVFETYIREKIIETDRSGKVYDMHRRAIGVVNAASQAAVLEKLMPTLTENEQYIVRRGRNAKPRSVPKNADIIDYKKATAFEALIGYLYFTGDEKRLKEILEFSCGIAGLTCRHSREI